MLMFARILSLTFCLLAFPIQGQANKLLMPGDVIQGHVKEEENCELCHKKFDKKAQSKLCMDCHKEVGKDVAAKKGHHGRIDTTKECKECHAEHKGRAFKAAEFDQKKFDHKLTDYELKGGHLAEKVKCASCHKAGVKFRDAPSVCHTCHQKDDEKAHKGRLGKDCAKCHTEKDWKTTSFDHDKTDFKLLGKHVEVKCVKCHIDNKYKGVPKTCVGCHKKDDDKAHNGKLGQKCETCHSEKDWKTTKFDHDKTKFPLLGKHEEVKCDKCHIDKKYKDTPKLCNSCHKKDDDKAHKGKFGQKCETCHNEKDWKESIFDHGKSTKFPLLGKHRAPLKCTSCHKGDLYKDKLEMTCISCHKKDDDKTHKGNFGVKCESCHVADSWKEIKFDHDKTKFPLLGKHRAPLKCVSCHKGDLYKDKLEMTCVSCHKKDDDKTHKGKFGTKCDVCHDENDWKKAVFDHDKKTKFPLLGKHKSPSPLKCNACHKGDLYKDKLAMDCFSCHEKDDKHKGQEGKKCESCHVETLWKEVDKFNHNVMSTFPLLGRHGIVTCKKCHSAVTFKDAKSDCWSCHEKDDVHKRRFGTECQVCHSTRAWESWDFDHNRTNFKLVGPHKKTANKCYVCHSKPMAKKVVTSTACGSCHDRDDVHNGAYGDRCDRCHDGDDWKQIKMGVEVIRKK